MKKFLAIITTFIFFIYLYNVEGSIDVSSARIPDGTYFSIEHIDKDYEVEYFSNWSTVYVSYPANAGEQDWCSPSVSTTHTYSNLISKSLWDEIELELGYADGETKEFSLSVASKIMKDGEYIRCKVADANSKSKIYINRYEDGDFVESFTGIASEPLQPQIKIDYYIASGEYKDGHYSSYENDAPYKYEIYRANENGNYRLFKKDYY